MSQHNQKVLTSFFYHFMRDTCAFANKWVQGCIVSMLEGSYSDKALLSGAIAHLVSLVDGRAAEGDSDHLREAWWSPKNVQMVRCLQKIGVNSDADSWSIAGEAGHQEMSGPTTFAVTAWLPRPGIRTYIFPTGLPILLSQSVTSYLALYP